MQTRIELTDKETKLIQFIRMLGYGHLTIIVKDRQPVRAEEAIKTIEF
jgi:hypothetical protein